MVDNEPDLGDMDDIVLLFPVDGGCDDRDGRDGRDGCNG